MTQFTKVFSSMGKTAGASQVRARHFFGLFAGVAAAGGLMGPAKWVLCVAAALVMATGGVAGVGAWPVASQDDVIDMSTLSPDEQVRKLYLEMQLSQLTACCVTSRRFAFWRSRRKSRSVSVTLMALRCCFEKPSN